MLYKHVIIRYIFADTRIVFYIEDRSVTTRNKHIIFN